MQLIRTRVAGEVHAKSTLFGATVPIAKIFESFEDVGA